MVKNFEFKICNQTQVPLKFKKTPVAVLSEQGIWIQLKNAFNYRRFENELY